MDLENLKKIATVAGTSVVLLVGMILSSSRKILGYKLLFGREPQKTDKNLIPSQSSSVAVNLPKVGDGSELKDYGKALMTFGRRCEDFGKGAGYVDVFGVKTLFLTNPEMVRKVLNQSVQHALWGGLTSASKAFFGKNVLFVLEGQKWRFLRSVMKHSLLHQNVKLMTRDVAQAAHEFTSKIKENVPLNFNELMGLYHLGAIGKSAFNFDLECLQSENLGPNSISKSFEFFIEELPRRSLNPDQSIDGDYETNNEQNQKWKAAAETVRSTISRIVEERLTDLKINPKSSTFISKGFVRIRVGKERVETRKDLLNAMIFANLEETINQGSEAKTDENTYEIQVTRSEIEKVVESITDNLVEILFAGYNTNVGTIANALHLLATHKEYQEKCRKEVDNFFSKMETYSFTADRFAEMFSLKKFKMIENLFLETLRLRPPAPMLARLLSKDFDFELHNERIVLPKSHPVWIPAEYLHTCPKNWAKYCATEFRPERFELDKPCLTGSYIPFSGGPRDCIGKNFAKLEAVVVIAMILKHYVIDIDPNYVFENRFNGFGYRPVNAKTGKVSMSLITRKRKK